MKRYLITLLLLASGAAQANSACDKPRKAFDGLYCLNKVYQEADKELNTNYGKLNVQLDAAGKRSLKAGQLAWIKERDNSCSRTEGSAFLVDLECATDTTIARSQFLQNRLRECAGAGCQNSKL